MTYCSLCLLGALVLLLATCQWVSGAKCSPGTDMEVLFQWTFLDFLWPSEKAREKAIQNKEYDPRNVTAHDINLFEDRYFVTTPRLKYGCPATLSTISDKKRDGQYLLKPFPNWEQNRQGNCDGLTSVVTTQIDEFGRLWALDSGVINLFVNEIRLCQPKLAVYDLTDGDKLVGTYLFPDSVLDCNSDFTEFQVDIRNGRRNDVFVYIADQVGFHIIVFDLRRKTFHRITHRTFFPDPHACDFYIAGTRVLTEDGIFSLALGPVCDHDRRVYYHALSSFEECFVMASTIRDKAYETNERAFPDSFFCFSKKRAQTATEVMTEDGIMFFQQGTLDAIACWNSEIDYNMENTAIVARNDTTLQAAQGLKLVGRELFALSSRLQLFSRSSLPANEINYRVLRASVESLICNTPCALPCLNNETDSKAHFRN